MLQIIPTKNLAGVTIRGDYADFDGLIESIYQITGLEQDKTDRYYGVKIMLLGICYDIRHAKQGDREIHLTDNGMDKDLMVWHKTVTPVQNVYFSTNVLFPDAIFTAASFSEMCLWSSTEIENLVIEEGVTRIGKYAFYECWNITEVIVPVGVDSIGDHAFDYCLQLTTVSLPDGLLSRLA